MLPYLTTLFVLFRQRNGIGSLCFEDNSSLKVKVVVVVVNFSEVWPFFFCQPAGSDHIGLHSSSLAKTVGPVWLQPSH